MEGCGLVSILAKKSSKKNGIWSGEMERDCMISHGASAFTKDRIYHSSDKYEVYVCKCGLIAVFNNDKQVHHCLTCNNTSEFYRCKIPYACKLLIQELESMCIAPRIKVNA